MGNLKDSLWAGRTASPGAVITPGRACARQAAVVAQDSNRRWPGTLTGAQPTSVGLDSVVQAPAAWQSGWWPVAL